MLANQNAAALADIVDHLPYQMVGAKWQTAGPAGAAGRRVNGLLLVKGPIQRAAGGAKLVGRAGNGLRGRGRVFYGYGQHPRGRWALTALPQGDDRAARRRTRNPTLGQSADGAISTRPTCLQALTLGHVSEASRLTAGQAIGSIERAMRSP